MIETKTPKKAAVATIMATTITVFFRSETIAAL